MPAQSAQSRRSVDEILDRAMARTQWNEEQGIRARYSFTFVSQSQKLKKDGGIAEEELEMYEVAPVRGFSYARLVSKNNRALNEGELGEERKRYAKFVERIKEGQDPYDEDDPQIGFDEELVSKYDFTKTGSEALDGRWYHVLAFAPKAGKLPRRRRIDAALNRSRGRFWIDEATYEVGRIQFELIDKVRLWWGIIGSLSEARGMIERRPIDATTDDAWFPSQAEIYLNGRVLFRSLHRSITNEWSDFQLVGDGQP